MQNTLIPASFLSVGLSTEDNLLKTDKSLAVIREEVAGNTSKLYCLFFGKQVLQLKEITTEQAVAEPAYYSSYE